MTQTEVCGEAAPREAGHEQGGAAQACQEVCREPREPQRQNQDPKKRRGLISSSGFAPFQLQSL